MEQSILTSIKKMLGPEEAYEHFDPDIIFHINSTLAILTQLGVGPVSGFSIHDKTAVWSDFIQDDELMNMVPTYIYLKVKLGFDPPTVAAVLESMERQAAQYEWRINVAAERNKSES